LLRRGLAKPGPSPLAPLALDSRPPDRAVLTHQPPPSQPTLEQPPTFRAIEENN